MFAQAKDQELLNSLHEHLAIDQFFGLPQQKIDPASQLAEIAQQIRNCQKCRLCQTRKQAVPGEGNPKAAIMFIGEGPGATEDEQGRPFVGQAGALLTQIIEKGMGLKREEVFITNVVKCRPPENREPLPDEIGPCQSYLQQQIRILSPKLIITLGKPATCALLNTTQSLGSLRGRVHEYAGMKVVPTYHPAYLLRYPEDKKKTWEDIQLAMRELDLPVTIKKG